MPTDLLGWAVPALSKFLPLDDESLRQIVTYSASLSKEDSAEHLKNLLGDSPAVLEFISSFNARRSDDQSTPPPSAASSRSADIDSGNTPQKQKKRTKAPLHSAGPPRIPENHGNTAGAYRKADQEEDYMSASASKSGPGGSSAPVSDASSSSTKPAARLRPDGSDTQSQGSSPARKTKLPPSADGPLISDYLPNVRSKTMKSSRNRTASPSTPSTAKSSESITTNNIADLTAAIAALEVSTNPRSAKERRICNCNATIHMLFTPAPNCLNCGKIICSLEGLQPCSFCGAPLLSSEEIQSMIQELRAERGQEKMRAHNESMRHTGGPGISPAAASGLEAAVAHRDKLLAFQAQNAQRTRIRDEAADFEIPNVTSTQWMTPAQRALALKKQQRMLREMEEKSRPEWEKKRTVMSLDIKGGRVVRTYQTAPVEAESETEDEDETAAADEGDASHETGGTAAFSKNPLLASGGLVRPVWKGSTGREGTSRKESQQTWRRVQDDNEDNEQWILDGGIYGHSKDSGQ